MFAGIIIGILLAVIVIAILFFTEIGFNIIAIVSDISAPVWVIIILLVIIILASR